MTYTKERPFLATLKERVRLGSCGSKKNTQHLVLDISDSKIEYAVGDCIGILPENDPEVVHKTLLAMNASGAETVTDPKGGQNVSLREFLTRKANISRLNKSILKALEQNHKDPHKKKLLQELLSPSNAAAAKAYLDSRELWDSLMEHQESSIPAQKICQLLRPLIPRLYSISSSMKTVGKEIHLTVGMVEYQTRHLRRGVATNYLCNLVPLHKPTIPMYIQASHGFSLPPNPRTPIIMVGPGTGIAPFRSFMQERMTSPSQGKNWLFFGEWMRSHDFFYEAFWLELQKKELLRLDLAFSRDQAEKIYVQHKMQEHASNLWEWLQEGAHFYVCGNAKTMAKDVDYALHAIIEEKGSLSSEEAKAYVKKMKREGRYQRDIY